MTSRNTVRKTVELDADNVEWFYETYSGVTNKASLSWIFDIMLAKFRELHERTPEELAQMGAEELKKLMEA